MRKDAGKKFPAERFPTEKFPAKKFPAEMVAVRIASRENSLRKKVPR